MPRQPDMEESGIHVWEVAREFELPRINFAGWSEWSKFRVEVIRSLDRKNVWAYRVWQYDMVWIEPLMGETERKQCIERGFSLLGLNTMLVVDDRIPARVVTTAYASLDRICEYVASRVMEEFEGDNPWI